MMKNLGDKIGVQNSKFMNANFFGSIIDLLQNLIRLLKLLFLASLSTNFSTIYLNIISKFVDKSAQKSSIFPAKAGYARGLIEGRAACFVVLLLPFLVWTTALHPAPSRRYAPEEGNTLKEVRDVVDILRHEVENYGKELQMAQEQLNNQESTLSILRQQMLESSQTTKETLKGNGSLWESKIASLEAVNKTFIADLTHLKTHANETIKVLEQWDKRIQDQEKQTTLQRKNIESLQAALRALTAALEVKEGISNDSKTYQIRPRDSLEKIAKEHNTTVKAIKELNNLTSDRIVVGRQIQIP
jgi:LysM repeat protein